MGCQSGLQNSFLDSYIYFVSIIYVTGPGKTGLIYIKYIYSCYSTYLHNCASYPNSVSFIKFLRKFYIYGEIRVRILCNYNELLNLKDRNLGQILSVDKTCFLRPGHIYCTYGLTSVYM